MKTTPSTTKSRPKASIQAKSAYPRRILLCVTGLTPQVVTETLYALAHRTPTFVPTEVHIITTTTGASRVLELLDPRRSQLAKLCKQYKLPLPLCDESTIHVIKQSGIDLADMRSAEENDAAADSVLDVVRQLTADEQCQIHFSIAGGRKTMGFYLGYCASLLGRAQDEMSHVLVNAPFENLPAFFFPPRPPEVLYDTRKEPGDPTNLPHDTADSHIDLAPVAFWRLRGELPPALLQAGRSFSETVRLLNALQGSPSLTLRIFPDTMKNGKVPYQVLVAGVIDVKLSQHNFALLWMFAKLAKSPPESKMTIEGNDWRPTFKRIFLPIYGQVTGNGTRLNNASEVAFKVPKTQDEQDAEVATFRNFVDKLNKQLREQLGSKAYKTYGVTALGKQPKVRYGLRLAGSAVQLEEGSIARRGSLFPV